MKTSNLKFILLINNFVYFDSMELIILVFLIFGVASTFNNSIRFISPFLLIPFLPVIAITKFFFGNKNEKKECRIILKNLLTLLFFPVIPFVSANRYYKTNPFLGITIFALYCFLYLLIALVYRVKS